MVSILNLLYTNHACIHNVPVSLLLVNVLINVGHDRSDFSNIKNSMSKVTGRVSAARTSNVSCSTASM